MIRAASHRLSMTGRSGRSFTSLGSISHDSAHRIRRSVAAVRELLSTAIDRSDVTGRGGEQGDGRHRALGRHREIGHDAVVGVLQVLDGRNQREVG